MAGQDTVEFLIGTETAVENARAHVGGAARIDGRFQGEVKAGHLVVGQSGSVSGTVRVETAEILGTVRGTIEVSGLLTVRSKGTVEGEISYGVLAIDAGGELVGALSASEQPAEPSRPAAPGAPAPAPEPEPESAPAEAEEPDEPDEDWTVEPEAEKATQEAPAPVAAKKPASRKPAKPASKPSKAAAAKPAGKPGPNRSASRKTTDEI